MQKREYCKVNISFFLSAKQVFCDIYLKVSESKYIKIFNRYDEVDLNDIKKYNQRNIQYLYVRERDFSLIMKKLVEELHPLTHQSTDSLIVHNSQLSSSISIQLLETVSESVNKLGLNREAIEMTNIAINTTMELIQRSGEIYDLLRHITRRSNYISEHSFLLTYISCSILKESPYAHPDNELSLSVAAFFHDIALDSHEKARVQSKHENQFKLLGIADQEDVIHHPMRGAKLVSQITGIPDKVLTIMSQHHEKYDGTGFPNGIDYKRIHPLSAIFNLSHELAVYFYDSGQNPANIRDILQDLSREYLRGNYKMALDAAFKVFFADEEALEDQSNKKAV